jgi:hypothetical protein
MKEHPHVSIDREQELKELSYLWEDSSEWTLHVAHENLVALGIVFAGDRPSVQELAAIRQLLDNYRDAPPATVRDRIGAVPELDLGTFGGIAGRSLAERASRLGLNVLVERKPETGYLFINESDGIMIGIEDDELARMVVERMREAGRPVSISEYD